MEYSKFQSIWGDFLSAELVDDDLFKWRISFLGPDGTPYAGGHFVLRVDIPFDYPFRPPACKFETKIWHTNVSNVDGNIDFDLLTNAWSPSLTIGNVCLCIRAMLRVANHEVIVNTEVGCESKQSLVEYCLEARDFSQAHAGAGNDAFWDRLPVLGERSPIRSVWLRPILPGKHGVNVAAHDGTSMNELLLMSANEYNLDAHCVLANGMPAPGDHTLKQLGLSDGCMLQILPRSSMWKPENFYDYFELVQKPIVVTLQVVPCGIASVSVVATDLGGSEILAIVAESNDIVPTVTEMLLELMPAAQGRLVLMTPRGTVLQAAAMHIPPTTESSIAKHHRRTAADSEEGGCL